MIATRMQWQRWFSDQLPHLLWIAVGILIGAVLALSIDHDRLEHLAKFSEAIVALFTIVLAWSTIGMWKATNKLWEAGEKQLKLTSEAVDLSKEISERQLRAYITITKHKLSNYNLTAGQVIEASVTLQNRGQTPANKVGVHMMAQFGSRKDARKLQLQQESDEAFSLAPGESTSITKELPELDRHLVEDLNSGKQVVIVLCYVFYVDLFGRERYTRMRASSNKDFPVEADGSMQMEWHGSDNDMT
jgi:hypothetical protein